MYGNNTFDSYNGGGFMATQTADTSFTPAKNCEIQGLRSLTVKQISEASQPSNDKMNCIVDGNEVNVKLVGLLSQKAEMVSYISFVLDDGTGRINCIRWENDAVDSKEIKLLSDGMYVKVHGHLKKVFEENEGVVVYSVRRVTDYDEIAYHFKDCMFVHLYNTTRTRMKDVPQVTSPMSNAAVRTPSKGYQPTSSDHFSEQRMGSTKSVERLILNYLQLPIFINSYEGAHYAEIAKHLNLPKHKILEALGSLATEGVVYSTCDDHHYKFGWE